MSKNIRQLSRHLGFQNNLFHAVAKAIQPDQANSEQGVREVAEQAKLSASVVAGTASFYDFLNEGWVQWIG